MRSGTNSQRILIRVSTFALLGTAAFGFAFLTTNNEKPATLETSQRAIEESSSIPSIKRLPSSKVGAAQTALEEAFENGNSFNIHYLGLTLTQQLNPVDIVPLLHVCSEFKGSDANIIRLIFALDLAYRNPALLQKVLSDPAFINASHLDIRNLFYYWAQGNPNAAFELANALPSPSSNDALSGLVQSNTPGISEQANGEK